MPTTKNIFWSFLLIVVLTIGYAILRYNIGKGVEWHEMLGYVFNKGYASTAFITLSLATFSKRIFRKKVRSLFFKIGTIGFVMAMWHGVNALILLSPERYPKFYTQEGLNSAGYQVVLIGILSLLIYLAPFIGSISNSKFKIKLLKLSHLGFVFSSLHVFMIGSKGWFDISTWPAALPPITLLCLSFGLSVVLIAQYRTLKRELSAKKVGREGN